jgi:predicted dehydrogenase
VKTLRVGIIGAGANSRAKHIPLLQRIADVEIVAVCNRSRESGERVARQFGVPDVMTDWRALVERDDLDAVVIGTWPYTHAVMTIAALAAGKHVLCEARMAANAAEARAMLDASRRTDRVAQIVPSPRLFRSHAVLRELVDSGFLGDIREIVLRDASSQYVDATAPAHWRQRRDFSGLNVLSLGIDYEMLSRYFGYAEAVSAQMRVWTRQRPDPASGTTQAVDVPETVHVTAEMASGALALLTWSGVAVASEPPRLEVYGSDGTLVVDLSSECLFVANAGESALREVPVPEARQGGWRVEQDFVNSIRLGTPVTLTSFVDGVRYMEFTEAVHRSALLARHVPVDNRVD